MGERRQRAGRKDGGHAVGVDAGDAGPDRYPQPRQHAGGQPDDVALDKQLTRRGEAVTPSLEGLGRGRGGAQDAGDRAWLCVDEDAGAQDCAVHRGIWLRHT
ncbi:MAG: hypothetical protein K0R87_2526, partial [Pseudonocardia sp.]|nr:hypothetical protein [Pseudonocardia sp.]